MKTALSALFIAAAPLSLANAADLDAYEEAAPAINWSGFYVGVHGGGGRTSVDAAYVPNGPAASLSGGGALGGVQAGYNWQLDQFVVGVEGDISATGIGAAIDCPNPAFSCESDTNWLGSVRGRAGISFDKLLLYGTAGVGFGGIKVFTDNGTQFGERKTETGWVAGAGVEYAISERLSVKAEFLHYDFGARNFEVDNGLVIRADHKFNTGKIGINFKF
ncbi:outer membrane protein [Shinella sp. BYT-45]|uniref:outer membrane protein n=1 Tax=Shinella sp. BYT-45 TaxID=3377377 RepID=UPI00397F9874